MKRFLVFVVMVMVLFPLFGITVKEDIVIIKYVPDKRPTYEQQLQLNYNKINIINSDFDSKFAQLNNE